MFQNEDNAKIYIEDEFEVINETYIEQQKLHFRILSKNQPYPYMIDDEDTINKTIILITP